MIVAEELTKIFDDFVAVDRISLSVPTGKVMVLLGKNHHCTDVDLYSSAKRRLCVCRRF
jgi:ABC-type uncharacterized transport system ATPase subunit